MSTWTEERSARAKELWLAGWSATQIANELGGVTRSAVMGKLNRMGCHRPRKKSAKTKAEKRPPITREERAQLATVSRLANEARRQSKQRPVIAETERLAAFDMPDKPTLGLLELTRKHCRWPFDGPDGETRFCGDERAEGAVYCPYHCAIAYRPLPQKQSKEHVQKRTAAIRRSRAAKSREAA